MYMFCTFSGDWTVVVEYITLMSLVLKHVACRRLEDLEDLTPVTYTLPQLPENIHNVYSLADTATSPIKLEWQLVLAPVKLVKVTNVD